MERLRGFLTFGISWSSDNLDLRSYGQLLSCFFISINFRVCNVADVRSWKWIYKHHLRSARFTYLSIYISIYLSTFLFFYLFIYTFFSIYLPLNLSIYLSIYTTIFLSIYLHIDLSIYLTTKLFIFLSIYT